MLLISLILIIYYPNNNLAFENNHGTNHAVVTPINRISTALDSGRAVVSCYIDLKKH